MIPIVPPGSNLASAVRAMQYLGIPQINRTTRGVAHRSLETLARDFRCLGSCADLALKFSTLPAALATLSDAARSELIEELSRESPRSEALASVRSLLQMEAHAFKRCPACVDEDLGKYGFAFSRSIHQVSSITICPTHWCVLESECGACGGSLTPALYGKRHLQDVCRLCGSRSGTAVSREPSKGYLALSDLLCSGMRGEAREVEPAQLKIALNRFSELSLVYKVDLMQMLVTFWQAESWQDVCACIGASSRELYRALVFGTEPRSVLGAYGLASFFHACVLRDTALLNKQQPYQELWTIEVTRTNQAIGAQAFALGLPMSAVLGMLSGNWSIARAAGKMKKLRSFIPSLPPREQRLLRRARRTYLILHRYTLRKRK